MKSLVSANLLICNDMLDLCQQDGDITKIWQGLLPDNCDQGVSTKGIAVNITTTQNALSLSGVKPWVSLVQKGSSTFGSYNYITKTRDILEYIPVSRYLNMADAPPDPYDIAYTIGRFPALVNTDDPNIATTYYWNGAFKGRSVAAANWEMVIEDNGTTPIEWDKVTDMTIYMDTVGNALPLIR